MLLLLLHYNELICQEHDLYCISNWFLSIVWRRYICSAYMHQMFSLELAVLSIATLLKANYSKNIKLATTKIMLQ